MILRLLKGNDVETGRSRVRIVCIDFCSTNLGSSAHSFLTSMSTGSRITEWQACQKKLKIVRFKVAYQEKVVFNK